MSMLDARRQMSAQAERAGAAHGEAGRERASGEADNPRRDTEGTGSGLLQAALARENLRKRCLWRKSMGDIQRVLTITDFDQLGLPRLS